MKIKNILVIFLGVIFFFIGFITLKNALPSKKEELIYNQIIKYSPYKVEKRFGGLTIINKQTGKKEKPSNSEIFHRLDYLNQKWAKENITMKNNQLIITKDKKQIAVININNEKEKEFIKKLLELD
ncbi:MAG: hypothetical protein IE890_02350 [Arcobacter sp.]|nr:hypothetical protein [Arcobacter sp.]